MSDLPPFLRVGWADYGRPVDHIVKKAVELIPGDGVLPMRWAWRNPDHFASKYGHLGHTLWSKTASYHLLMLGSSHACRIWTDTPATCLTDVPDHVAARLEQAGMVVFDIPEKARGKTRPLTKRVRVSNIKELTLVLDVIKQVFGV